MDGVPTVTQDDVDELISFIRNTLEKTGCKGVVIGLSGGLDSAVVTKLCVDALGADKVLNIFMPSGVTISDDYIQTKDLSKLWGTEYRIMDIQPAVDSLQSVLLSKEEAPLDRGNISARCRMIVLYNQARKPGRTRPETGGGKRSAVRRNRQTQRHCFAKPDGGTVPPLSERIPP